MSTYVVDLDALLKWIAGMRPGETRDVTLGKVVTASEISGALRKANIGQFTVSGAKGELHISCRKRR